MECKITMVATPTAWKHVFFVFYSGCPSARLTHPGFLSQKRDGLTMVSIVKYKVNYKALRVLLCPHSGTKENFAGTKDSWVCAAEG